MLDFFREATVGQLQWVELIYAAAGSFIGIFVPMWIDKSKARRQEKDARKKLLAGLNRELDSVKQLIEACNAPDRQYDIFSFSTFVWESIISAGMLPEMLADKDIKGEQLMEIYSELSLLSELHEEFCQCSQESELLQIHGSIREKRLDIYEKICAYQA